MDWFLPNRKRRFATTTVATSDLLVLLAEDGHTVSEAHDAILYDAEGRAVLARFAEAGYGDVKLKTLVA